MEQMPAIIAPKRFETHQAFVADPVPELARTFKATLMLASGGLHRATAQGLAPLLRRAAIHALRVAL